MKLHELFEKAPGKIASKDPKVIHAIKTARAKYHGRADDDLSALISMMGDEQKVQDRELGSLDDYNMDQDVEINDTERVNNSQEAELDDLRDQISKLQSKPVKEENDTRSQADWIELVVLTASQYEDQMMQVVMGGDEDTALHMFLKDVAHEVGVPEHMRNSIAYQAANRIPIPDNGKVEEEIVPYKAGHPADDLNWIDDETGELFTNRPADDQSRTSHSAIKKLDPMAISMFGDIAAGGGDPIDHVISNANYDIEAINATARDMGYGDAHEWAQSYQQHESEEMYHVLKLAGLGDK